MHQRLQLQLGEGERREHGLELYVAEPAAIGVGCTKGGEKGLEAVLHALGGAVAAGGGGGGAAQPVRTALVHKFGQMYACHLTNCSHALTETAKRASLQRQGGFYRRR